MRAWLSGMILAVLVLAAFDAGAQETADPCAVASACRKVGSVSVPIGGGRMMKVTIDQTVPWVAENNVILFPGETLIVSLPDEGAAPLPVTLVAAGDAASSRPLASGEMRFIFTAAEDGMMMKVESRNKRTLRYTAVMVPPSGEPRRTSICPVQPGMFVYESWPNPIAQLSLSEFIPVKKGDLACR